MQNQNSQHTVSALPACAWPDSGATPLLVRAVLLNINPVFNNQGFKSILPSNQVVTNLTLNIFCTTMGNRGDQYFQAEKAVAYQNVVFNTLFIKHKFLNTLHSVQQAGALPGIEHICWGLAPKADKTTWVENISTFAPWQTISQQPQPSLSLSIVTLWMYRHGKLKLSWKDKISDKR